MSGLLLRLIQLLSRQLDFWRVLFVEPRCLPMLRQIAFINASVFPTSHVGFLPENLAQFIRMDVKILS